MNNSEQSQETLARYRSLIRVEALVGEDFDTVFGGPAHLSVAGGPKTLLDQRHATQGRVEVTDLASSKASTALAVCPQVALVEGLLK